MKFRVNYQKKEEFEINELNIDLEFSEENKTGHPVTSIVKIIVGGVIAIIAIASALAVYGAEYEQPGIFRLAEIIFEINHSVIDIGRDVVNHLQEKK